MYYKYNFITREEEIFGKCYAILCFDCSSGNISYSDDDSSTEYSSLDSGLEYRIQMMNNNE